MKTLLTLLLILTSQILTSQMSYEFSTWLKNNNEFVDNYEPEIDYHLQIEYECSQSNGMVIPFVLTITFDKF